MNDHNLDILIRERFKFFDKNDQNVLSGYKVLSDRIADGNLISHQEYKFLCWLSHNDLKLFPVTINKPAIPIINSMDIKCFVEAFCLNERRSHLFERLLTYVTIKAEEFKIKEIDIVLGGSFIDPENIAPRDIDCVIQFPWSTFELIRENYERHRPLSSDFPNIDVEFIPETIEWTAFWSYATLTHLGNVPELKEPNVIYCRNNSFKSRDLIKVHVTV